MDLSTVKDAVRAARRLQVGSAVSGRLRPGGGMQLDDEKARGFIAKAMGYSDHDHLVGAFGSVETPLEKVVANLARGSLTKSEIVEYVFPWARGNAPPAYSTAWRRPSGFMDLDQNTPFLDALANCPPGRAIVLKGDSYTGKSRLVAHRALRAFGSAGEGHDQDGISFGSHSGGTPGSFASGILSRLDPKHDSTMKVSAKIDDLHRRIADMPDRVIALDNLDWIGSSFGRRAQETAELVASLVDGSRHRWVLIGIGADRRDGRAGIDEVIDMSPRLRALVDAVVELPLHAGDDADVERITRAWEMNLPMPDRRFFADASNRRKLMEAVDAPVGIGIVANGLRTLGKALGSSITPSSTDISVLLDAMIVERDRRRKEDEEVRISSERAEDEMRKAARDKARARRRNPSRIGHATVADLLALSPTGEGSEMSRYSAEGEGLAWEVEAKGVRFTCRVKPDARLQPRTNVLTVEAMDKATGLRSGDVSINRGVVTMGRGSAFRMLSVRFEPDMVPGWTDHGLASNHSALAAAVSPMLEERPLDADTVREVRRLVRILRDATGSQDAGVVAATAVMRQQVYCHNGYASEDDLKEVADLVLRDYPMTGWRYSPHGKDNVGPVRISFWQMRNPKPPSGLDSIERRIRHGLPNCSEELRAALLELHAKAARRRAGR